jgi:hypothetical protein
LVFWSYKLRSIFVCVLKYLALCTVCFKFNRKLNHWEDNFTKIAIFYLFLLLTTNIVTMLISFKKDGVNRTIGLKGTVSQDRGQDEPMEQ